MPINISKDQEALDFHASGKPGKLEISPTKPLETQKDLALAYSPGVAVPCLRIKENPETAYDYTAKGNLVAVISNGTAVLGLGNLGSLASKPVMEGKAVLFKRFANIDGFDIEVATEDVDRFVSTVELIAETFGGINLEDIKAPECFIIEERLKKSLNIPVFHDDQHGTAICVVAGLINALHLTGRDFKTAKIVVNGAGAAAIACANLIKLMGLPAHHLTMVDRTGVIYKGRADLNPWKEGHAVETRHRTLAEALEGADVALGLSAKGAFTQEMLKGMNAKPIIFAMANPDPEITPEEVRRVRHDAIVATGRSDYPNQVNNTLCFPYIFRGALDVRAREINDAMKMAAAHALAALARTEVPATVIEAYGGKARHYGPDYIIPAPFDPRLIACISVAVAKAAIDSGVARKPIEDLEGYERKLQGPPNF
jgi:malate dehydrogenase (oxaloacetate-decarboxylating)(NADP+)